MQEQFLRAKQKLTHDLACATVTERLATITLAVVAPDQMAQNLRSDHYKRYANVPAYYDPNQHTVYLNEQALSKMDALTVFIVCYHELIHGASIHRNYKQENANVFQSGVKIERYRNNRYSCLNRLFNEGIVQYLTTHNNNVDAHAYAYPKEVKLMQMIVKELGLEPIKEALLYGKYDELQQLFDARYGEKSFVTFTRYLDKRQYDTAKTILDKPAPAAQLIPFSFSQSVFLSRP